nr:hypothetical protein [Tanacetum cinerariifolium]
MVKIRDNNAVSYITLYTEQGAEAMQECDNVAEYKVFSSLWISGFRKVHFEALGKRYNTTCFKKEHKEIWREVKVQVSKPPSWTSKNVIKDIDALEQATNAS